MRKIVNIIFDLGNVFLDVDFNKTKKAFEAYGITDYASKFGQHHACPMFQLFETGKITPETFFAQFREMFEVYHLSDDEIREAWNAMLGHFSKTKMEWLIQINKTYRTFLFSNTNKLHQDFFEPLFEKEIGRPIQSYFEHTYYSHDLGLRKPDASSFEAILSQQQLKKEETLFVDDTIGNIEIAKKIGLQTFHLTQDKRLEDIPLL